MKKEGKKVVGSVGLPGEVGHSLLLPLHSTPSVPSTPSSLYSGAPAGQQRPGTDPDHGDAVGEPSAAGDSSTADETVSQSPRVALREDHVNPALDGGVMPVPSGFEPTFQGRKGRKRPTRGSPQPTARKHGGATGEELEQRKERSRAHELRVASIIEGRRVPGSGALGIPGDVANELLLGECKSRQGRTVKVDLADIEKIVAEAEADGRTPALAMEFLAIEPGVEKDWVLLPLRVVAALLNQRKPR